MSAYYWVVYDFDFFIFKTPSLNHDKSMRQITYGNLAETIITNQGQEIQKHFLRSFVVGWLFEDQSKFPDIFSVSGNVVFGHR